MTNTGTNPGRPSPAMDDMAFGFLQTQVGYFYSHLQIADAKAGGLIAYISVLSGSTTSKVSPRQGHRTDLQYGLHWPVEVSAS